jgi:hypothetical protein
MYSAEVFNILVPFLCIPALKRKEGRKEGREVGMDIVRVRKNTPHH